ncbi:ribosomal protein S18-alanine N-acetyltransferase [Marinobacterium lutimaris]|uniref:[Ribosomal protein bS18]-alanine N-acetyltransferase n=1 Tax=Marinobacterium lutimaris TaxID=568106 RepID=A0A1H6BKA7_9GAMM|nr:ribosomal protein S18-alanine N-acetyltransferase [Marinobacterium lutimaris]SEG61151.1 ribosomal-protein-alanine N-acetyltransferase [Marinobacterium lutimaris]
MVELRRASLADLEAIHKLDDRSFHEAWSEKQWHGMLSNPKRFRCWLQDLDGRPLGFLLFGVVLDEAELLRIGVDPAHQGEGRATAMLEKGQALLEAEGVASFHLEVRESNHVAQHLYQRCGWQQTGRRRNYYNDEEGSEDALLFSRYLD